MTDEERGKRPAVTNIDSRTEIIRRFEIPPVFCDWANGLLRRLSALAALVVEEDERIADPEYVNMRLWLGEENPDSLDSIESTLDAQDIYDLLQPKQFLTDTPLEYYRWLLIREEMKRALMLNRKAWRRSWIHGPFFMELLYNCNEGGEWTVRYDAVKLIDRRYTGKTM